MLSGTHRMDVGRELATLRTAEKDSAIGTIVGFVDGHFEREEQTPAQLLHALQIMENTAKSIRLHLTAQWFPVPSAIKKVMR